ncbi:MAG: helix-turn-helix transcriptional regulator [Nitrosomonadales bacterium]|nr:helix-turn-helix transcriptional regulator [Nitrosomonadales bacterium]
MAETSKVSVPEDGMGERIRARREEKNLTQEALSILTKYPQIDPEGRGLSRPSIVGYEQGKNLPDARGIRLLATALDTTPSWLVLGKYDEREPEDPRQALLDALDRYTLRRSLELGPDYQLRQALSSKKLEGLDSTTRTGLEIKAREEALAKNQEIHKQRTAK